MKFIKNNISMDYTDIGFSYIPHALHGIISQRRISLMSGYSIDGALAEIILRKWAVLIVIVGVILIYGVYRRRTKT